MAISNARFCECCIPAVAPAPAFIWNRPGLAQIAYRLGTFATFRQAMLLDIHRHPELSSFLTRESDDHAVTILELFAAVGDVLTFYNERIANEMFLGQALHKASVAQLVALVGYIPRPALSATGVLSFEIEDGKATRLWRGLKVMSVPGPDETAQIFETLEEIRGLGCLSAAPVFAPTQPVNALAENRTRAPITHAPELSVGDTFVVFGRDVTEEKTVRALSQGPAGTHLSWHPAVQAINFHPGYVRAAQVLRRLRFFGHNAPATENVYDPTPTTPPQNRWSSQTVSGAIAAGAVDYPLETKLDDLKPGAHLLLDAGAVVVPRLQTARVIETSEAQATLGQMADTVTHIRVRQTIAGRPSAAIIADGSTGIFARSGGGHPVWLEEPFTAQDLQTVSPTPFFASSDTAPLRVSVSRLDLYVRDEGHQLQRATWSASWSTWTNFGGILTSPPAPVLLSGGAVRVFVRGTDLGLWMFDTTGGPVAPVRLGGILVSAPTAVSPDGSQIAVFVRGIDDALWLRFFDGVAWHPWERLGGRIDGNPVAVSSGAGRIDVFARGLDSGIVHFRRRPAGWDPIRELGGEPVGDPAALAGPPDWAAAAVRTTKDTLAIIWRNGDTWADWADRGGAIGSDPALTANPFSVTAAARHQDGTLTTLNIWPGFGGWVRHGDGFTAIPDRREARIYEIGDDIAFQTFDYPETAEGGLVTLPLQPGDDPTDPEGLGALQKGRKIILSDGRTLHRAEVIATLPVAAIPGTRPDHLLIAFQPPLPKTGGALTLFGNVADVSHGETQREDALGSGDAARPFQSFEIPPGEIAHLPSPGGTRPIPQVELRVDGVLWKEVASLYGRSIKERAYTLQLNEDMPPVVRGGDGVRAGARFPTGALNVRMTRRLGAGLAGNLKAGQLSIPLEKPVGMKGCVNPFDTSGGAPGETSDDARNSAPDRVRTFGRIVSLQDFAMLATASGLAARAQVTWVWRRMERAAHLTVAGPGGAPLSPENLALLHDQLTASRDPNRRLLMANMVRVPIVIAANILCDPAYRVDDVLTAVRDAVAGSFAFETRAIGGPVHLSDVYATLQMVEGVVAADINLLHLRDHDDLSAAERAVRSVTADPVQPHIRLYPARPTPDDPTLIDRYQSEAHLPEPPPPSLPAEQAFIEDPGRDIRLTAVEAL